MKDNLVCVDLCGPKGNVQQKGKTFRLLGGKPVPGSRVTLQKDTLNGARIQARVIARCLRTGILLVERV